MKETFSYTDGERLKNGRTWPPLTKLYMPYSVTFESVISFLGKSHSQNMK